jgi:DNA-binding transcriptional LysR family regulator
MDESERNQLSSQLLLRSPLGIACSKNRRFRGSAAPKLRDFRNDNFLCFEPENGHDYEDLLRELCRRVGGFEPKIGPRVNSPESLVSMIAADRGVFLGVELGTRTGAATTNFHPLNEQDNQFELSAIWKQQSRGALVVSTFIEVLKQTIRVSKSSGDVKETPFAVTISAPSSYVRTK